MEEKVINLEVAADTLSSKVIDAAIQVHRELGPGLLESAYEECLSIALLNREISYAKQVLMPIRFEGKLVENAYRLDLLIENELVVEIKACEKILPIHEAQILTYLKLSKKKKGLIINFNNKLLKDGIRRFALTSQ